VCDTAVVVTPEGVLFGKNSDREPGEAQAVELHPARAGARAVIVSRPAWMWGCEMGANDAGVVGGNEAVFTRVALSASSGRSGMDLLRATLERAATAAEAVDVLTELLSSTDQGGPMGFRDRSFRYSSSFLLADATEAWVVESAGRLWAAERVTGGVRAISNALTIGASPTRVHPEAEREARRRGWLPRHAPFDFARAFGSPVMRPLTGAEARRACTAAALSSVRTLDAAAMMAALRDHRGRHPSAGLRLEAPCAHASFWPTRHAGQTTGSMVSLLRRDGGARHLVTGTSSPCLSVFKPIDFDTDPRDLGPPAPVAADDESLWWRHERLHRAILAGWGPRHAVLEPLRASLEADALASTPRDAWAAHRDVLPIWLATVQAPPPTRAAPLFRAYWRRQSRRDGITP